MIYLLIKALISGIIIALVCEIAKRNAGFGALVASLPLISVLGWPFLITLALGCALTIALYLVMTFVGPRFGLKL